MTFGRLVARRLSKYKWYNPNCDNPAVTLDHGWSYYEHITLPRYIVDKNARTREKAHRGSLKKSELYPIIATNENDLSAFGAGTFMYFTTVKLLIVLFFIIGLFRIPQIVYYNSSAYANKFVSIRSVTSLLLRMTAACDEFKWVTCKGCDDHNDSFSSHTNIYVDSDYYLYRKNDCSGTNPDYLISATVPVYVILIVWVCFHFYQKKAEIRYHEMQQTAQDYSIQVVNPPHDAYSVQEWRIHFSKFKVKVDPIAVTVILNNRKLLLALLRRRSYFLSLSYLLPDEVDLFKSAPLSLNHRIVDTFVSNQSLSFFQRTFVKFLGVKRMKRKIIDIEKYIQQLQKEKYNVCRVFVTFETKEAQREAIKQLATSKLQEWGYCKADTPKFRGKHKLKVNKPYEPDDLFIQNVGVPFTTRVFRMSITFSIIILILVFNIIVVQSIDSNIYSALYISASNVFILNICKLINLLEIHESETENQLSMYFKLTLFRWSNTAILMIITVINSFTETLVADENGLLSQVVAIFITEIFVSPAVRLLDITGLFMRHILAPRCKSQGSLNMMFLGTRYELAERYTESTKVLFLTFFYSILFPGGYFLASIAFVVYYYSNKVCLLRIYRQSPKLGTVITTVQREYFMPLAIIVLAVISTYMVAGFPFDNLCKCEGSGCDGFEYEYCNQDLLRITRGYIRNWNASDIRKWMNDSQIELVNYYKVVCVVVMVCASLFIVGPNLPSFLVSIFKPRIQTNGKDQCIDFSCATKIHTYVPQIMAPNLFYPLLACKMEGLDEAQIGWKCPNNHYEELNLERDIDYEFDPNRPIFSCITYWPANPDNDRGIQDTFLEEKDNVHVDFIGTDRS